jgi:hypothetical protein
LFFKGKIVAKIPAYLPKFAEICRNANFSPSYKMARGLGLRLVSPSLVQKHIFGYGAIN